MICFEITINDEKICTAGLVNGRGVLTTIIDRLMREPAEEDQGEAAHVTVGGLANYGNNDTEHLDWVKRPLSVGDQVSIRVVDSDDIDDPVSRERIDPDFEEKEERKYYERLKKKYEAE